METTVTVEPISEVEREIRVEVPRQLYDQRFNAELNRAVSGAQVKGFRPGRAPRAMVAKMYGDRIHSQLVEHLAEDGIHSAIEKFSLKVVGTQGVTLDSATPGEELTAESKSDMRILIRVDLMPEPEIKDYTGLDLEVEIDSFSEAKVDEFLENLRKRMTQFEPVSADEPLQEDDYLDVAHHATIEGKDFEGGKKDHESVQKKDTGLRGILYTNASTLKIGASEEFTFNLPDDFEVEELRGKETKCKITLNGVYRPNLPAMDSEFAKSCGEKDMDSLRETIRTRLKIDVERQNAGRRENALLDKLIERNSFAVPNTFVDREIRMMLIQYGVLQPTEESFRSADVSRFREPLGGAARLRVQKAILLNRLVELEDIKATPEMIEEWIENEGKYEEDPEKLRSKLNVPQERERIEGVVVRTELLKKVLASSTITEVPLSSKEHVHDEHCNHG